MGTENTVLADRLARLHAGFVTGIAGHRKDKCDICFLASINADLIAALEAARKELVRGGHIDRWKTITIIDVTLAKAKEVTHDA